VSVASGQAGPQVNSLNGIHSYRRFNPALGVNYNPSQALGFFASYSESMRAPTPIELSCANPSSPCALPTGFNGDPDLKAVVAKTFELGARGKLNSRLSWSTAIYNTKTSNDIEFLYDTSTTGYFNNVGSTERRGLELGIQSKSDPFKWSINYGYVNAQYLTPFTTAQGLYVTSGSLIPGIADQTLKIKASYRFTPDLTLGGNWVLVSGQYAHGDENNQDANGKIPGYGVVNFDLHYKINDELNLFAVLNNAFNQNYSTYGILGTNVYSGASEQFRTPAAPRAIWMGANYSFGRH
jgi:outer membrane receptor protein involved in Fe transport